MQYLPVTAIAGEKYERSCVHYRYTTPEYTGYFIIRHLVKACPGKINKTIQTKYFLIVIQSISACCAGAWVEYAYKALEILP